MTIRFSCPNCHATFSVPDSAAGKRGRCKKCSTSIAVPAVSEHVLSPDVRETPQEPTPPAPAQDTATPNRKRIRPPRVGLLVVPFCAILALLIVCAILLPGNQGDNVRDSGTRRVASRGDTKRDSDGPIPPPKIPAELQPYVYAFGTCRRSEMKQAIQAVHDNNSPELARALFAWHKWFSRRYTIQTGPNTAVGTTQGKEFIKQAGSDVSPSDVTSSLEQALSEPRDAELLDVYVEALDDENAKVRGIAISALEHLGTPETVPALLEALDDLDNQNRYKAISGLQRLKEPKAVPKLIKLLEDESTHIVLNVARALGTIGDERAIQPLDKWLQEARRKGIDERTINNVQKTFDALTKNVRFRLYMQLADRYDGRTEPPSQEEIENQKREVFRLLVKDETFEDRFVREAAAKTLKGSKVPEAVPLLVRRLREGEPFFPAAEAMKEALVSIDYHAAADVVDDPFLKGVVRIEKSGSAPRIKACMEAFFSGRRDDHEVVRELAELASQEKAAFDILQLAAEAKLRPSLSIRATRALEQIGQNQAR